MNEIILETEWLTLEKLNRTHFEDLYSLLSNITVHKFFPSTLNREQSEEFYMRIQRRYAEDDCGFWAVRRKEDRAFIGICEIVKQRVEARDEFEIGIAACSRNPFKRNSGCIKKTDRITM